MIKDEGKMEGKKHVELFKTNSDGKTIEKEIFTVSEWKEYAKEHNYSFEHFEHHYILDRVDSNGVKYQVLEIEERIGDKKRVKK